MALHRVTLIPGDGIGPEITQAVLRVLEAARADVEWEWQQAGASCLETHGSPLPESVLESIRRNRIALKGPVTTPIGTGFRSVNVTLRQTFDLYANVRPNRTLPGVPTPFPEVDILIFRENTEGLYAGIEYYDERLELADAIARISRRGSERILRFAFEYARRHGRRKVTLAHKANILKKTSGLFLEVGRQIAADYPDIAFEEKIIDSLCMELVRRPEAFDCIVTTNLFGDILSDLCAGLVGGLGVVPGANIGDEVAIFEAVHGSAPDIAGQNRANPTALLLSAVMMLEHLNQTEVAERIRNALYAVLQEGRVRTPDLGGTASTSEFAEAIAQRVQE
ncbi:MAG: isocitrate/isopropylmalate family dehydrogenase [Bacteroidetes bacterium]|nr:isocitrate/isopropylmalate family dehydrogenase [Bacteroidota bacterium]MCX7907499.1 isocitrate/isopropylmalate family dehydrogenase [Bacteroidota bacterium]MDW8138493.1 isocitrate/isopropylmalate family dehydrogenase [Bacteroidota bacterium]